MAAVIGIKHPKWDERPLLLIVRKQPDFTDKQELLTFLEQRVAKWWIPEEVVFVDSLPVGGTGKVQKNELRLKYGGLFSA
jgi:3-(methylthio)propionyl---CoA ligase